MSDSVQALFEAVREACSPNAWSRGVELTRSEAVSGERAVGEISIRISTRGGLICPTVTLEPEALDWDCDCSSPESPCEHVAAAVIALRRARREGGDLPEGEPGAGRVGYRFSRRPGGLGLERTIVTDAGAAPLRATLSALASGRVEGPRFTTRRGDLAAEQIIGSRGTSPLPRGLIHRLLEVLEGHSEVEFDGKRVRTSAEPVMPLGEVVEDEGGLRLQVRRDPGVTEVFDNGVALCEDTLRPVGTSQLTGRELEQLTRGRVFGPEQIAELVTEVLPSLEKRIRVEIRTGKLPSVVRERPRIRVEVRRDGDGLGVLATLVYGDPVIARIDAGRLVPLGDQVPARDEPAERQLTRRLQSDLELLPGRRLRLRGHEAVTFADRVGSFPCEIRGDAHEAFTLAPAVVPNFTASEDGFDLRFESPVDSEEADPRRADPGQVLRAWRDGTGLVPLDGGGVAPLPEDWLSRFGDRVSDLLAARDASGRLPRCALPDLGRLCDDLDEPRPEACEELRSALERFEASGDPELPDDLGTELRGYQKTGVGWLCALRDAGLGALLADDMGLGKTIQALCALRGRTLVVAPTSVLHNWSNEIARFRPALRAAVYHGPRRSLDPDAEVTLTTYAILRLDADRLAEVDWGTVVLDEAQAIKNPDSKAARAAYRLRADFRLTLSGTPVENRLDELWSQVHFANPGLLGGRADFDERYAKPIATGETGAAERLRQRIRPFLLRRLKRDVAPELPPRTEVVLRAQLSTSERDVYDAVRAAALPALASRLSGGGGVMAALEALLRLRQAACHPALVPGQTAETSSKLELLLEWLDEALSEGHKALVFSQWTSLLDLVEPKLHEAGIKFGRLDGSTTKRGEVVAHFQATDGPPVLLVSLKAGGLGLNLTAADHVFILDPWWNPAAEDQAADRAHRIGQDRPVVVHRLVAEGTVEERILALQDRKRALADAALGEASSAASVTREELLALLE